MPLANWLRVTSLRLRSVFRRNVIERDLVDELRDHLESKTRLYAAQGLSTEDARRAALRDFGGIEFSKEQCRDARRVRFLENLARDFRHSARGLRKSAGFTAVAVLILTLGIGANVAIFSMVNALLLHPYPFRNLDELMLVWESRGIDEGLDARRFAPADIADLRSATSSFSAITTYQCSDFNLSFANSAQPVLGCHVSSDFFNVLGVAPAFGRSFLPPEEQPGADDVAVLSYPVWQRQFAADPAVLGRSFRLNGRSYTVVGVMPSGFVYPAAMQLWVPLALSPTEEADRATLSLNALARLKPGITRGQALAEARNLEQRLQQRFPATNAGRSVNILDLRKELYSYTLPLFLLLQAAALFVLLLAGANLANLLFARRFGRQKEIALRAALGAGRMRLGFLFISETLLLTLTAGIMATAVSFWTVKLLRTSISPDWSMWVPGWNAIRIDSSVLGFTLLLTLAAGILFGAATVLHSGSLDLNQTLKDSTRGSLSPTKARVRSALVVLQVALALVLLVCAGLAMQGFSHLAAAYQGFNPTNVLHAELILPNKSYARDDTKTISFFQHILQNVTAQPFALSAGLISNPPASNVDNRITFFTLEGRQSTTVAESLSGDLQIADAGLFQTLHIPLISGRLFSDSDTQIAPRVALISQTLATQFWPRGDAIGHRLKLGRADSREPWMTVIGIVADLRQNWWNPVARPAIYQPYTQSPDTALTLLVRTGGDPLLIAAPVRDEVRRLEPDAAITGVNTLEREVADSIAIIRILGALMTIFGLVALALACIGVYGMLSESVAQRTREIGIRISLGADRSAIRQLIFAHALKLSAVGLLFGVPLALAINRVMATTLYGIIPMNFGLLCAFTLALLAASAVAAYLPARHAMNIDPIEALRSE